MLTSLHVRNVTNVLSYLRYLLICCLDRFNLVIQSHLIVVSRTGSINWEQSRTMTKCDAVALFCHTFPLGFPLLPLGNLYTVTGSGYQPLLIHLLSTRRHFRKDKSEYILLIHAR